MFSVQKMENTISPGPESSINSSVLDSKMLWRFSLIKEKYKQTKGQRAFYNTPRESF